MFFVAFFFNVLLKVLKKKKKQVTLVHIEIFIRYIFMKTVWEAEILMNIFELRRGRY